MTTGGEMECRRIQHLKNRGFTAVIPLGVGAKLAFDPEYTVRC